MQAVANGFHIICHGKSLGLLFARSVKMTVFESEGDRDSTGSYRVRAEGISMKFQGTVLQIFLQCGIIFVPHNDRGDSNIACGEQQCCERTRDQASS